MNVIVNTTSLDAPTITIDGTEYRGCLMSARQTFGWVRKMSAFGEEAKTLTESTDEMAGLIAIERMLDNAAAMLRDFGFSDEAIEALERAPGNQLIEAAQSFFGEQVQRVMEGK